MIAYRLQEDPEASPVATQFPVRSINWTETKTEDNEQTQHVLERNGEKSLRGRLK